VSACLEAYRATSDSWCTSRLNARSTGSSAGTISGLELYSSNSGGCRDALHVDRVNGNQGAESTLAFLLSLAEMRLMQMPLPSSTSQPRSADLPMKTASVKRTNVTLRPDRARVLIRPFQLANDQRAIKICARVIALRKARSTNCWRRSWPNLANAT